MFLKNINYLLVNLKIGWQKLIEYKMNLYIASFEQTFYYLGYFVFFFVISNNFSDIINWTLRDFLLFMMLVDIVHVIGSLFHWKMDLKDAITTGDLNLYLTKPLNGFIGYTFSNLPSSTYIFLITNLIALPIIILYFNIQLHNIFASTLIFIGILFATFSFYFFINSINFHSYGLKYIISNLADIGTYELSKNYPHQFFKRTSFKFFLFVLPMFFVSSLLVPMLRDYPILNINLQIIILIFVILFFSCCTWINWHLGLKKYEAYG